MANDKHDTINELRSLLESNGVSQSKSESVAQQVYDICYTFMSSSNWNPISNATESSRSATAKRSP